MYPREKSNNNFKIINIFTIIVTIIIVFLVTVVGYKSHLEKKEKRNIDREFNILLDAIKSSEALNPNGLSIKVKDSNINLEYEYTISFTSISKTIIIFGKPSYNFDTKEILISFFEYILKDNENFSSFNENNFEYMLFPNGNGRLIYKNIYAFNVRINTLNDK